MITAGLWPNSTASQRSFGSRTRFHVCGVGDAGRDSTSNSFLSPFCGNPVLLAFCISPASQIFQRCFPNQVFKANRKSENHKGAVAAILCVGDRRISPNSVVRDEATCLMRHAKATIASTNLRSPSDWPSPTDCLGLYRIARYPFD